MLVSLSRCCLVAFEAFDTLIVRPMEGVRNDRYKLVTTDPGGPAPFEELYDLQADPFELSNLAGEPGLASLLERLRDRLAALLD